MRDIVIVLLLAGFAGLSTGCNKERPSSGAKDRNDTVEQYWAASAMSAGPQRDAALEKVVEVAAAAGDEVHVKASLELFNNANRKDAAAESSAQVFANAGDKGGAVSIAKLISAGPRRDALLAKLAEPQK